MKSVKTQSVNRFLRKEHSLRKIETEFFWFKNLSKLFDLDRMIKIYFFELSSFF